MGDEGTYEIGWCERMKNSFGGMCLGFVLVIATSVGIFWNESHFVLAQATADLMKDATALDSCTNSTDNAGSLVFMQCNVNAPNLKSHAPELISGFIGDFQGASLSWTVSIKQWQESTSKDCQKNNKGGETCHTSYSYSADWVSTKIDSAGFHESGHTNTGELPSNIKTESYAAPAYSVFLSNTTGMAKPSQAGFALDQVLQDQLPSVNPVNATQTASSSWSKSGDLSADSLSVSDGALYTGDDIGAIRIQVSGSSADKAGACAKQANAGNKLGPWPPQKFDIWGRKTYELEYLRAGSWTLKSFIDEVKSENKSLVWIIRFVCLALMILGFRMIFSPLSVLADSLMWLNYCTCNCLGTMLDKASQAVIGAVSCACGCSCFLMLFCAAWCVANPTYTVIGLGIIISLIGAGIAYHLKTRNDEKAAEAREGIISTPYVSLDKLHCAIVPV